jgi:hypothetical protein
MCTFQRYSIVLREVLASNVSQGEIQDFVDIQRFNNTLCFYIEKESIICSDLIYLHPNIITNIITKIYDLVFDALHGVSLEFVPKYQTLKKKPCIT